MGVDAVFAIHADIQHNLMRVEMSGFFDEADVHRFSARYREMLLKLRAPGHLTLVDIRNMKIQPQAVVEAFSSLLASADVRSRRLAFVCNSTLARLQAQRLTDREGVKFFDNEADAETWILE